MNTLKIMLLCCLLGSATMLNAQVSINEDGTPPDPSAMLDVQSWDKGFLPPRIDFNDRPNPAAPGLLIYVTANGPLGNDALYFFDGTYWRKITSEIVSGSLIGTVMEGGVVFYFDDIENVGFVAAQADQAPSPWGCFGQLMGTNAQYTSLFLGSFNSFTIVNNCSEMEAAAHLCDTLTLNGYTDWFLPSRDELFEMYQQKNVIGGFQENLYWSSTEAGDADFPEEAAWIVNFIDGSWGWTSKSNYLNVRCVRQFVQ